ncbi:endoglucanase 9-like [Cucumis sativus]|nr:endoglucanase 9-like [Cucumis sativus]
MMNFSCPTDKKLFSAGRYPKSSPVKFRGDSGLEDGVSSNKPDGLIGGFYDSGNNIKFTFPTAYTITLLSWSVIEYHPKYADMNELDHVKDIIRWGTEYLLKIFVAPNATSDQTIIYSQVGSSSNDSNAQTNDNCWQRPEDMMYPRPISTCDARASDLAGEIVAALSASSLVFREDTNYSRELAKAAEKLFQQVTKLDPIEQGTYSSVDSCGGEARKFYNSSSYTDELIWAGTWLFFATGNTSYLSYATDAVRFQLAQSEEASIGRGIFNWNNKFSATAVLLTRLLYFHDTGYPYEYALGVSSNMTEILMCSYLIDQHYDRTPGGLILLRPDDGAPLQFAATASFLSKLYSDYLDLLGASYMSCIFANPGFSLEKLRSFSNSQLNYILGDNPLKMSYVVGYGNNFPTHVHHRAASIPWDGQFYSCAEGDRWLLSKASNPNILSGAMVAGPDMFDHFSDDREKPWFTEPSIASNAGLVAALVALNDYPGDTSDFNGKDLGIDKMSIFDRIPKASTAP